MKTVDAVYAEWIRKNAPVHNPFAMFRAGFEAAQFAGLMWKCPCGASNDSDAVVCHACCRKRPAPRTTCSE